MGKALCSRTATKDEKVRKARKAVVVEAEKKADRVACGTNARMNAACSVTSQYFFKT
jgi:hypothetical protein